MKKKLTIRLASLVLTALLLLSAAGCGAAGDISTEPPDSPVDDLRKSECSAALDSLRGELAALFGDEFPSSSDVSASDALAGISTASQLNDYSQQQKLALLKDAAKCLLAHETVICAQLAGEDAAGVGAAEVESAIVSASDLEQLYILTCDMENRLFDSVSTQFTPENEKNLHVVPFFSSDESGKLWLYFFTGFALPGFEDGDMGYLLRLSLDGGAAEMTVADSIYSHDCIRYDSGYCVRFDLTSILKNSDTEKFLTGRNRVTFTAFMLDDSFSESWEFYRMRNDSPLPFIAAQERENLAAAIASAAEK